MQARLVLLLVGAGLVAGAHRTDAGRTHYGWLYEDEVNPERGVEVEAWIVEEDGTRYAGDQRQTYFWWAPTIGITDHVELALPVESSYEEVTRFGAEVRVRPDSPDELEAGCWTSLYRAAIKRIIEAHDALHLEGDAVVAYHRGRLHAELDGGVVFQAQTGKDPWLDLDPAIGVSVRAVEDLRVGAEAYGEWRVTGNLPGVSHEWFAVGPDVAWTHGRFWAAAALLVGVYQIDWAPRVNLAVAF